ncbi:SusC/RagA family TonB-linked outer membrane protein [Rhodocytophaga rosea]|uniref:SusC/RagA family TonB-linked outer membrane protein n=1 Tax=Rhodocytophaga rosea TaxID=2704465 RepID=A0A6C0GIU3_9BACT|nr:SusC/RagA family TonB-linked outer membrane protein [Rhodocytophaga rosea]QHT67865.1 SusC/RagA family TonB-linked outer membrane protein [Rhodocytophaga rosea]
MKRILIMSFILLAFVAFQLKAQDRTVTGKVTSADDGTALPGVNVVVKGTTTGTTTNTEGSYSINVPADATLVYSFIGLQTQEVVVGSRSTIDVKLASDVQALSEVVVTALGVVRTKNELPYAAQSVVGEELSQTRTSNFVSNLSGRIAGVNISNSNTLGGSTNVVIRGNKSLTGNNQALFVIDGVPVDNSNTNTSGQQQGTGGYDYGNAAADINPDNIASVTVLKGAAATVLYGSRAANGAVVITTKKGSKNKGIGVTINAGVTTGFVDKSTFAKYQKEYGAGYGPYYGTDNPFFYEEDINGDGQLDLIVPVTEDASFGGKFDPNLQVYHWDAFDPTSPNYQKTKPWVGAQNDPTSFLQNSVSNNQSIFIDGGSEKGTFVLGFTRNEDKGILPNSKINKNMVNFNATYDITDKLSANASVNFSQINGLGRYGTGYDSKNLMGNFRQWWQTNVDVQEQKDAYFRTKRNMTWNQSGVGLTGPIFWDNPYWTRYENYQNDSRSRYFGYAGLTYKFTDWLSLTGRAALDSYNELQEERIAVGSIDVSEYARFNRSFREYNYDLLLNFNKDLSESLNLTGLIGGNIRKTQIESISAQTNGGLLIPGLYGLLNTANPLEAPVEQATNVQVNGVFANLTFGFRDFLFLDLAGRRDQSSTLPKGNNAYYYPSVSSSLVFSEFTKESVPWFTYGKLRANYAEVGNTAPALYIQNYYDVPTGINGTPLASVESTKYNENLKPERTKSFEIGIETSFLDGRTGFDVTYYNQRSVDQIVPLPVSRATGYDFKVINAGEIENKGFEVSAFVTPVKTPSFSWTLNLNWSRNRNKVKELAETNNLQLGSFQGGVSLNAALGEPYGTLRGSNYVYHENGQRLVDEDGYYVISPTSNEIIGDVNPDWQGGISNTLKYKGIALSFLIDIKKGGDLFSLDQYYGLATGLYPETAGNNDLGNPVRDAVADGGGIIFEGVKEDGTPNTTRVDAVYGTFGYDVNPAAAFIYDASYVKLREATITYSLPESIISKIAPFKGVDFSVVGRNLWIIHKNIPYADPEAGLSSGNIQGYQSGAYPTTRNVGFNVRLRF